MTAFERDGRDTLLVVLIGLPIMAVGAWAWSHVERIGYDEVIAGAIVGAVVVYMLSSMLWAVIAPVVRLIRKGGNPR